LYYERTADMRNLLKKIQIISKEGAFILGLVIGGVLGWSGMWLGMLRYFEK